MAAGWAAHRQKLLLGLSTALRGTPQRQESMPGGSAAAAVELGTAAANRAMQELRVCSASITFRLCNLPSATQLLSHAFNFMVSGHLTICECKSQPYR
jgi:hypothetical protein